VDFEISSNRAPGLGLRKIEGIMTLFNIGLKKPVVIIGIPVGFSRLLQNRQRK
jgi:hypothetical protein